MSATLAADPLHAALLRDVCEHPADDMPRLVLADWLEEHDQDGRAQFIRLQVEAARYVCENREKEVLLHCVGDDLCPPCEERRRILMTQAYPLWTCHLVDKWDCFKTARYEDWERGFVWRVHINSRYYWKHWVEEQLFRLGPITRVELHDRRPHRNRSSDDGPDRWFWSCWMGSWPTEVFTSPEFVQADVYAKLSEQRLTGYPSFEAAREDLVQAVVAHGRELAGLGPLS